jgi:hypothetical protein
MCLLAAWASWLRGAKYIHHETAPGDSVAGRKTAVRSRSEVVHHGA